MVSSGWQEGAAEAGQTLQVVCTAWEVLSPMHNPGKGQTQQILRLTVQQSLLFFTLLLLLTGMLEMCNQHRLGWSMHVSCFSSICVAIMLGFL